MTIWWKPCDCHVCGKKFRRIGVQYPNWGTAPWLDVWYQDGEIVPQLEVARYRGTMVPGNHCTTVPQYSPYVEPSLQPAGSCLIFCTTIRSRDMSSWKLASLMASSTKTIDENKTKFGMVSVLGMDYIHTKFQPSRSIPSMVFTTLVPIFWEFPFFKNSYLGIP